MSNFWVLGIFLLIYGIIDLLKKEIPIWPMFPMGIFGIFSMFERPIEDNLNYVIGILIGIGLLVLSKITKEEIGYGDGFVLIITGLYLGYQHNLMLLLLGLLVSAIVSLFLMVLKRAGRKTRIPFIPCLTIAYFILWRVCYI